MRPYLSTVILLVVISLTMTGCSEADWKAIGETLDAIAASGEQVRRQREAEAARKAQVTEEERRQFDLAIYKTAQKISEAIEPTNPIVRSYALQLAAKFPGEYNVPQICSIWYHLKENWRYVSDPRTKEYLAPASETIKVGLAGDCDDFAILMASLIEAIGGRARIILTMAAEPSDHAYCEVYIGNGEVERKKVFQSIAGHLDRTLTFYARQDENADYWVNLDWWADYPAGPYFKAQYEIYTYPDGTWEKHSWKKN